MMSDANLRLYVSVWIVLRLADYLLMCRVIECLKKQRAYVYDWDYSQSVGLKPQLSSTLMGAFFLALSWLAPFAKDSASVVFPMFFAGAAILLQVAAIAIKVPLILTLRRITQTTMVTGELKLKKSFVFFNTAGQAWGMAVALLVLQIFLNSPFLWGGIVALASSAVGYERKAKQLQRAGKK